MLNAPAAGQVRLATANAESSPEASWTHRSDPRHHPSQYSPPASGYGRRSVSADGDGRGPQGLVSRLMADMDPDLLAFLQTNVNSFVKWDLIHFFHSNPHTMDTAENIARYAGRDVERTARNLEELTEQGILSRRQLNDMHVYSFSNDPTVRETIHEFVNNCKDRQFRIKAIYHVIRSMH